MLTLLLGGARSGKSGLAVRLASAELSPATVVATGEALDDEMAERIAVHRAARPAWWATVEEPIDLEQVVRACPDSSTVVVDCLTLWVSNLLADGRDDSDILMTAASVAGRSAQRSGKTIVVSNEVGSGIVPGDPVSRRYRDLLGRVNTIFAEQARDAFLVVAGRVIALEPAPVQPAPIGAPAS